MTKLTYTMFISFIGNTILSILKILAGVIGKSSSLIADGIHTFSDLSTDLISISEDNTKDKSHEKLINVFIGICILGLGLVIIFLSIKRDIHVPSVWLVIISLITIIYKYLLSSYILNKGIIYNNIVLVGNARESDADVISSVIVFLGLVLMQLSTELPIFKYSDMIASIIVGFFVIKSGFDVLVHQLNDTFGIKEQDINLINKVTDVIKEYEEVININSIDITKYGPYNELKCELVLNSELSLKDANKLTHNIETKIRSYFHNIEYVIIKINTNE